MKTAHVWGLLLMFLIAFWGWVIFIVKGAI